MSRAATALGLPLTWLAFALAVVRGVCREDWDVAHVHDPTVMLPGLAIARRRGSALVYERSGDILNDHMPLRLSRRHATSLSLTLTVSLRSHLASVRARQSGKGGMHRTPPSRHTVDSVLRRIDELLPSAGGTTQLADVLQAASDSTSGHAAWLVLVQVDLLDLPGHRPDNRLRGALPGPADAYFRARVDGRWNVCDRCGYRLQLPLSVERADARLIRAHYRCARCRGQTSPGQHVRSRMAGRRHSEALPRDRP